MSPLRHLRNPRLLAGVAFVGLLVAMALWPGTVSVDTEPVGRGPLRVTVREEGETRVRDRFVVSAPVGGRLQRIELEPGDAVSQGETVLARFFPADPTPLDARSRAEAQAAVATARANLESTRAQLGQAEAAFQLARAEARRARELAKDDVVAEQVVEAREAEARQAEEAVRSARFAVAAAEHNLAMAQARLIQASGNRSAVVLRSPIDGVVLRRHRESEGVVAAGEPLLELGDPRQLEIVSDLLSSDAVKVSAGDPVLIEQWGGDETLHGRVRLVEPSGFMKVSALGVEEQRVNVIVDPREAGEEWRELGDGYRVEVAIVIWEEPDVVTVPTSSLFRRGDDWAVFVSDAGRARLRVVKIGRQNERHAQVLSGLDPGARVIVHPSDTVSDGVRVEEREAS
jgi:HlyD family secretion protein